MLSQIDNIIFPDRCDVLEVAAQRYVYPIYKNGSSSLGNSGFKQSSACDLLPATVVDVFVREPYDRFLSGVQTFLRYNRHLDRATSLHYISHYLFLNTHFCPQFHWLVNLQRYSNVSMRLLPIEQLSEITEIRDNVHCRDPKVAEYFANNQKVQFYLQLDKVLTEDLVGQTVTMKQILETIKSRFPELYQEVIQRSRDLCTVLD